jgi:hypothetical protein
MADPFWSLRNEILASEQIRNDWLKYKLFSSAVVGGVALGVNGDVAVRPLLALIPLLCVYADVICGHNQLRIAVLSQFLRQSEDPIKDWELFASKHGKFFSLESLALSASTRLISLVILLDGVHNLTFAPSQGITDFGKTSGIAGGAIGLASSIAFGIRLRNLERELNNLH